MRIHFLVNEVADLKATQTTSMLIRKATLRGHEVLVGGVGGLSVAPDGQVWMRTSAAVREAAEGGLEPVLQSLRGTSHSAPLDGGVVWIRTNPARDPRSWAHEASLDMLRLAQSQGCLVVNDPAGLQRATSKLYLSFFPAWLRPETLVSGDPAALMEFVRGRDASVLKPLQGTWGRDVFMLGKDAVNLPQIVDVLLRQGLVIAQGFVAGAEQGDVRLVLLDGEVFRLQGHTLAVRRRPGRGDFRSNIHAGGRAEPVEPDAATLRIAAEVGPRLRADGILLAGLDIIGDKLIEINVYSTGGFRDAERFYSCDFCAATLAAVEALAGAAGPG